jgi:hypothetical protein
MFVVDETALDPEPEEMPKIVALLRSLRSKFSGRFAIVTSRPGCVTTASLVAFDVDGGSDSVRAFLHEDEARAWLLGGFQQSAVRIGTG